MPDANLDIADYEKKCEHILEDEELKFAALLDPTGRILAGRYKDGVIPPLTEEHHEIMRMEIARRVAKRKQFDEEMGHVKYSASRRENAVIISLPIGDNAVMIIAEPHINIDRFAFRIIEKLGRQWGDYNA